MFKHVLKPAALAGLLICAIPSLASAAEVEFEGKTWTTGDFDGSEARVDDYMGRTALYLGRNFAGLQDIDLGDMVIEYDYAATHPSGFIGVRFRDNLETGNREQFYTRPHQSGQPDATQYMGVINGASTWQLHAGPNEAVATELPAQTWIKVRIVAIGDRADIFVGDMTTPLIHVPDLRSESETGNFSIYASDRGGINDTGAYISNVVVRAAASEDAVIGLPAKTAALEDGLIRSFEVSAPFKEETISSTYTLADAHMPSDPWVDLGVESDGIANLARTTAIEDGKNTVFVRMTLEAETAENRMLRFGYSDRIRLFVNGELVFFGNAQWRSRDHRFLGTISLEDSIALHLKAGENEIIAAVSESFGGWGFKAALQN